MCSFVISLIQSPIYSHRVRQVQEESWVHRDFKGPRYARILMDKYQQLDEGQIFNPIQIQGLCTKKKIQMSQELHSEFIQLLTS